MEIANERLAECAIKRLRRNEHVFRVFLRQQGAEFAIKMSFDCFIFITHEALTFDECECLWKTVKSLNIIIFHNHHHSSSRSIPALISHLPIPELARYLHNRCMETREQAEQTFFSLAKCSQCVQFYFWTGCERSSSSSRVIFLLVFAQLFTIVNANKCGWYHEKDIPRLKSVCTDFDSHFFIYSTVFIFLSEARRGRRRNEENGKTCPSGISLGMSEGWKHEKRI